MDIAVRVFKLSHNEETQQAHRVCTHRGSFTVLNISQTGLKRGASFLECSVSFGSAETLKPFEPEFWANLQFGRWILSFKCTIPYSHSESYIYGSIAGEKLAPGKHLFAHFRSSVPTRAARPRATENNRFWQSEIGVMMPIPASQCALHSATRALSGGQTVLIPTIRRA